MVWGGFINIVYNENIEIYIHIGGITASDVVR